MSIRQKQLYMYYSIVPCMYPVYRLYPTQWYVLPCPFPRKPSAHRPMTYSDFWSVLIGRTVWLAISWFNSSLCVIGFDFPNSMLTVVRKQFMRIKSFSRWVQTYCQLIKTNSISLCCKTSPKSRICRTGKIRFKIASVDCSSSRTGLRKSCISQLFERLIRCLFWVESTINWLVQGLTGT